MDPVSATPTRPRDYAALSAGYAGLMTGLLAATHARRPEPLDRSELPVLALATFAMAKLIAKEKVDSWVREPFVDERPNGDRQPKGSGMRYAVGELLTCTRCVGAWSALSLVGLRLTRPREASVVLPVLATSAANDFLQSGFTALCGAANVLQERSGQPAREAGDRTSPRFFHEPRA